MNNKKLLFKKGDRVSFLKWFLLGAALIVLYKSFDRLSDVFTWIGTIVSVFSPIVSAVIAAYLLNRPMMMFERLFSSIKSKKAQFFPKHSRGLAVLCVCLCVLIIFALIGSLVVPALINSVSSLFSNLSGYFQKAAALITSLTEQYSLLPDFDLAQGMLDLGEQVLSVIDSETIVKSLQSVANIGSALLNIIVTVIVSIYALLEKESLISVLRRVCSLFIRESTLSSISSYLVRADKMFFSYFSGQLIDCVVMCVLTTIAMLTLGIPDAIMLGFVLGIFNIIPHFGPIIANVFVVFILIVTCPLSLAIWTFIILIVIQQVDANIINPKIIGDYLNMSSFWVMFGITVGGGLFGFAGMFLGVPAMAVIRMFYRDALQHRREVAVKQTGGDAPAQSKPEESAETAGEKPKPASQKKHNRSKR